jgi:2OG-Fe(II) oxygenase superfamily
MKETSMAADFIGVYDNALSPELCLEILQTFNQHKDVGPGKTGHGVDVTKKNSLDLSISHRPEWTKLHNAILDVTIFKLMQYLRSYPYALTGGLSLSFPNATTGQLEALTAERIAHMNDTELGALVFRVFRPGSINVQKYLKNSGGYHFWHSEIYPREANCETLHRVLLFMFYLNSVEEGGETEFYYQQRKFKPTQGQMIIAPAGFTHTHKGHIPLSHDKYILTSWILFNRAETLYQQPGR